MTPVDVCSAIPSNISDSTHEPSPCLTETLPSPPESSKKRSPSFRDLNSITQAGVVADHTPHPSPASCTASTEAGSGRLRKRVDFSPWTTSTGFIDTELSIKSLPPSRECQSSKSILKPAPPPTSSQEEITPSIDDLATMLDTILRQLAGDDGQIKFDAYTTLCSALKAYDELPNGQLTKEKVQLLLDFIKKDITHQFGESMKPTGTNGMLQALKVLVIIVWNKRLSGYLTDSYRIFLVDHSTRILEEHKLPKAVLLHYLHLLSTQEFSSRIMSTRRAIRLLEALKDISDHVKGNGVQSERLMVYQRILEQARGAFKSRPSCWAAQLLAAMTSSIPDTRKRAITLGHRATVALGSSSTVATSLRDLLDGVEGQEDLVSPTICKRMAKMMKTVDEGRQVPRIWAIVMLLMKGRDGQFHEWSRLHEWLKIIQKCFNCGDSEVRVEANKAWNKLVYIARPYEGPRSFLTKMLIKPILVQLERPVNGRPSKSTKSSAFSSYCNLLYYALRPGASFDQYDAVWDEYLMPTFKEPFLSSEHNSDRACRILMALFWREKVSPWRESRALDAAPIEPEELPVVDGRWVRSRARSILDLFERLFRSSCWGPADYPETAFIAVAWRNFAKALGESCRKEVISSPETNEAVGHVTKFMMQMCQEGPARDSFRQFHFVCKTMLLELGPLSFVEGPIADNAQGKPPMIRLLEAVPTLPDNCTSDAYLYVLVDLLQLASKARSSAQGRIYFYRQCTQALLAHGLGDRRGRLIWTAISRLANSEISTRETKALSQSLSAEDVALHVTKILQQGVPYQSDECESWSALLKQSLLSIKGSERIRLSMIDQLLTSLEDDLSEGGSLCTAAALQEFLPVLRSSPASASRKPPARPAKRPRDEGMSLYCRSISLLDTHLSRIYGLADLGNEAALGSLVSAAISELQARPSEYKLAALITLQPSLALWLEDGQHLMTNVSLAGNLKLTQARKLCPAVIDTLGVLSKEIELKSFDKLLAAAFRTSHKITISHMVKMWNSTYGREESLEYGDMLKDALARLIPYVDLELPGLSDLRWHERTSPPLVCLESPKDDGSCPSPDHLSVGSKINQQITPSIFQPDVEFKRSEATHAVETKLATTSVFKARARHDDSQIDFVSIVSSPLPEEAPESQNLTARQKEVKERQNREAGFILSDLRPGHTRKIEACRTEMLSSTFAVEEGEQDGEEIILPATPILLSPKKMSYEEAAQYSPTPRSKQQALRLGEIEIPSSPISVSTPDDGKSHAPGPVKPGWEKQCQSSSLDRTPRNIALAEDLFSDPSAPNDESGNTGPAKAAASKLTFPAVGEGHVAVHPNQAATGSLDEGLPITVKEAVSAECVEAKEPVEEVSTMTPIARALSSAEDVIADSSERDSIPSEEVAGSSVRIQTLESDSVTTRSGSENDRSNDTDMESSSPMRMDDDAPPEEHIQIDSDENDFLSASQLSQDLERAASLVPSSSPIQPLGASSAIPQKREVSSAAEQASKRRKTTGDSVEAGERSRMSSTTAELDSSPRMHDCIEVESTAYSPQSGRAASVASQASGRAASVASQASSMSHVVKRGRGRPRKAQAHGQKAGPAENRRSLGAASKGEDVETKPKIEIWIPPAGGRRRSARQASNGATEAASGLKRTTERSSSSARVAPSASAQSTRSMEAKTDSKGDQASAQEAMELLEKALSMLRRARMDPSDLKTMDELVVEIRTEARTAAQRNGKSGT